MTNNPNNNPSASQQLPGRVWYVHAPQDSTVLLALNIVRDHRSVRWFDTVKERSMEVAEVLDPNPQHFVFRRGDGPGGTYTFEPLTLERYEQSVRKQLLAGKQFTSLPELLTAIEQTRQHTW